MTGHWSYCDDDECGKLPPIIRINFLMTNSHAVCFPGPNRWPTGQHQSPINIDLGEVERKNTHDGIKFVNYDHPIQGDIVNNGHSGTSSPLSIR